MVEDTNQSEEYGVREGEMRMYDICKLIDTTLNVYFEKWSNTINTPKVIVLFSKYH